nr:(d)CMP kinase [Biomaibacter acetigenes]
MAYNIAIDGPAGAGKSTVAKRVAERLNMTYIDTGAMYRAVTLKAHEKNKNTAREIVEMLKDTYIEIKNNKVILDGEDVTEKIRSRQVTQKVSYIAKIPEVRFIMVEMQKKNGWEKRRDNGWPGYWNHSFARCRIQIFSDSRPKGEGEKAF